MMLESGSVFPDLVGFDALGAYLYALDSLGSLYPHLLEIREPDFFRLVLCMGNIMPCLRAFSTNITPS
jgi:hypothetical protein